MGGGQGEMLAVYCCTAVLLLVRCVAGEDGQQDTIMYSVRIQG